MKAKDIAKKNQVGKNSILKEKSIVSLDSLSLTMDTVYKIHSVRNLTDTTYILRFDRNNMQFEAGQHITLGVQGDNQTREYSIYSTEKDPFLEVLIKEVDHGMVSKRLKKLSKGDVLNVDGPFGFFTIGSFPAPGKKYLFIATGTGIAPFHSIAGSHNSLDYRILHGVRYSEEAYEKEFFPNNRYILCTSRDSTGDFTGRVTDYVRKNPVDSDTLVYLCGNCDMIYEVYDVLISQGLRSDKIRTEVYF
ncbi:MAG: hypothetical protein JXJ22_01020 [Bacteroidales bacterium]|nr:hypothetical protein [Bacteroidales bacterium]